MTPAPQSARNISNTATGILSGLGVCCHRPKSSEMASAVHRFKTAPATAARPSFHDEGASAAALDAAIAPNPAANPDAPFFFLSGAFVSPTCKGTLQRTGITEDVRRRRFLHSSLRARHIRNEMIIHPAGLKSAALAAAVSPARYRAPVPHPERTRSRKAPAPLPRPFSSLGPAAMCVQRRSFECGWRR